MSNIAIVLLIILILALVGALPVFPHATNWGYTPGGILLVLLIVVVILAVLGKL